METTIENGMLVIKIPLEKTPRPSSSGKTLVVAATNGFTSTNATVDGKPISISVNATIKP